MGSLRGSAIAGGLLLVLTGAPVALARPLPDGDYLFGEAPRPGELGRTYLMLAIARGRVSGAMYMPRSSFDCVEGRLVPEGLQLIIRDSYSREPNPVLLSLDPRRGAPEGFHRLRPQANDRRMLDVCRAALTAGP